MMYTDSYLLGNPLWNCVSVAQLFEFAKGLAAELPELLATLAQRGSAAAGIPLALPFIARGIVSIL
jgi:hypothetical protein